MLEEAGADVSTESRPPRLVVPDNLFAPATVLRALIEGSGGRNATLVLKSSLFAERSAPVQPDLQPTDEGFRFPSVRFESGGDEEPIDVVVDPDELVFELPLPSSFGQEESLRFSLPRHPVMTLHHWVHVLWANQAAAAMVARREPKARLILRAAWAAVRRRSVNKWKVLSGLNTIGRGCDIHPTAILEGATLEDGVTVGPYARVLFSRLGRNSMVMAGAQVEACTLGERAMVCQGCVLRLSVLYPGAIAGQRVMQQCVLGRDVVTTEGSYSMDLNFENEIRVLLDGELHSSGSRFLGSAYGHGSRVGTGVWLASGRSIPNGTALLRAPQSVTSKIPSDVAPGSTLITEGGVTRVIRPDPEAESD